MTLRTYRVRFTEWQAFARDIPASSEERAMEIGQAIRDHLGTIDFEEIDGGTENWEAQLLEPADHSKVDGCILALAKALAALERVHRLHIAGNTSPSASRVIARLEAAINTAKGGGK
jgi:hypothetical protein